MTDWTIYLPRNIVSKVWKELINIPIDEETSNIVLDTLENWTVAEFCLNRILHTSTHGHSITVDDSGRGQALDEVDIYQGSINPSIQRRRHNRRVREGLARSLTLPEMTLAQVRNWVAAVRKLNIEQTKLDDIKIELCDESLITNSRIWTLRQFVTFYVLCGRKNKLLAKH